MNVFLLSPSHSIGSTHHVYHPKVIVQTDGLFSDVLRILRKLRPSHKFIDDYLDDTKDRDLSTVENERAIELLQRVGRPGFTSLEESLKNSIEGL